MKRILSRGLRKKIDPSQNFPNRMSRLVAGALPCPR